MSVEKHILNERRFIFSGSPVRRNFIYRDLRRNRRFFDEISKTLIRRWRYFFSGSLEIEISGDLQSRDLRFYQPTSNIVEFHRWICIWIEKSFGIPLGSKYADLQQKITLDTSCGNSQTFHCSKVTTMESLRFSTGRVGCDFLLKIGCLNFLERLYIKENKQTVRCNQPK